jgi:hypothetical protein
MIAALCPNLDLLPWLSFCIVILNNSCTMSQGSTRQHMHPYGVLHMPEAWCLPCA